MTGDGSSSPVPDASSAELAVRARELLEATERLAERITADADRGELAEAFALRDRAFDGLREAFSRSGTGPAAEVRELLGSVRALDAAMISAGTALLGALREERNGLQRRKNAAEAHAAREREAPRLLTVRV